MKKRRIVIFILIGVIAVYGIFSAIFYSILHGRAMLERPLILIHEPYNEQQVFKGRGAIVHATARNESGLRRIELWVNDRLVSSQEPAEDESENFMVLSESWIPAQTGTHTLVVRAISANGVSGQSSIELEVIESNLLQTSLYTLQTEDTLESIAEDSQTTVEALSSLNDGTNLSDLQSGDEIIVPSSPAGGSPRMDSEPGADEPEAPGGAAYPPGSLETLDIVWPGEIFRFAAEPVQLVVEVDTLRTQSSYENLHCYVGLASSSPRWMPDMMAPRTDESFTSANGEAFEWEVYTHMGGGAGTSLTWMYQPVPIQINCVGITGVV
jgi:LysM repeat protein